MIQIIRVYRVLGDSLSCRFSQNGSLATAVLTTDGQSRSVAGQLPGLLADSALPYLEWLGYRRFWEPELVDLAQRTRHYVSDVGLWVEAADKTPRCLALSFIRASDRILACPKRVCLIRYQDGKIHALNVTDNWLAERLIYLLEATVAAPNILQ